MLWTAALIVPLLIAVALYGTVWSGPDQGASMWIVGEMFIIVQGGWTLLVAYVGASARRHRDRSASS